MSKKARIILFPVPLLLFAALLLFNKEEAVTQPIVEKSESLKPQSPIYVLSKEFEQEVTQRFYEEEMVGGALAIIYNDSIIVLRPLGTRTVKQNDSVNTSTIFRLASVSKTFAGTLAGILKHNKHLHLDEPVKKYIPDLQLKDSASTQRLTIENILTHTSGLVPHAYDNLIEDGLSYPQILERLNEVDISAPPGELYGYQNFVFSLFDSIVEACYGQTYEDLIAQQLFKPLAMNNASAGYCGYQLSSNKAFPHAKTSQGFYTLKLNNGYFNTLSAAGISCSISDISKYLLAFQSDTSSILSHSIVEDVFHPRIKTPLKWQYFREWDKISSKHYGLGWRIIEYKGRQIAYHGGYVRGYRAEIAVCREEKIAIAFLSNSPSKLCSHVLPDYFDRVFGFIDTPEKDIAANVDESSLY